MGVGQSINDIYFLRHDHYDLALIVFSVVRSELWYKTELSLYADLVSALAKKGMTMEIDRLVCDLEVEGSVQCDDKGIVRLVKAVITAERRESTVRIYGLMKRSGCGVDNEYLIRVLGRGLRRNLGMKQEIKVFISADTDLSRSNNTSFYFWKIIFFFKCKKRYKKYINLDKNDHEG